MKLKKYNLVFLLLIAFVGHTQNLKQFTTFYDPFTKTKVHESYTTLPAPPYLKHGVYKEWDEYSNLKGDVNFVNGKRHGALKIYFDVGLASVFDKKLLGKVYTITHYANDLLNGLDQLYDYKFGKQQLTVQKTWLNGKQVKLEEWYDDGKPKLTATENGMNMQWYSNGQKEQEVMMKNGVEEGKLMAWYEGGQLQYQATFKGGKMIGDAIAYYEDGIVKQIIKYDPVSFRDLETTVNYPSGKVKWERNQINQAYDLTTYDSLKGYKKTSQGWIINPKRTDGQLVLHGKSIEYHEDGSVIEEVNYEYGNANGSIETMDNDGKVMLKGEFRFGKKVNEWLYYLKEDGTKTNKISEANRYRKIDYGERGEPTFSYTDYFLTGEKMTEGFLRQEWPDQNVRFIKRFYKSGQLAEQGPFNFNNYTNSYDGKTGEWKTFYENGNLKSKGSYRLNETYGMWEFYDEDGKLVETKMY